jgi:hypothetical protein
MYSSDLNSIIFYIMHRFFENFARRGLSHRIICNYYTKTAPTQKGAATLWWPERGGVGDTQHFKRFLRKIPTKKKNPLEGCFSIFAQGGSKTVLGRRKEDSNYVFLEIKLRGLVPNFHIYTSVCDLYIPRIGPVHLICCSQIGRPIVGNI